jgi:hypothetical protein
MQFASIVLVQCCPKVWISQKVATHINNIQECV